MAQAIAKNTNLFKASTRPAALQSSVFVFVNFVQSVIREAVQSKSLTLRKACGSLRACAINLIGSCNTILSIVYFKAQDQG